MPLNFPSAPVNGERYDNYYFDASVGVGGAWRAEPIPVGGLPAGSIIQWASNTPPANWLLCDGSAVSRSAYPSLFAAIGTQYGAGDGSTTFNLPDLRGRVPVGKNSGTFSTLGATGGAETHTLTIAEMPSHQHTQSTGGTLTTTLPQAGSGVIGTANTSLTSATGGGGAHNNLQPYLVTNYIIKATAGWTAGDSELAVRVGTLEAEKTIVTFGYAEGSATGNQTSGSVADVLGNVSFTFTKKYDSSKLFIQSSMQYSPQGAPTDDNKMWVRIGSTDYEIVKFNSGIQFSLQQKLGTLLLTGIPAGTYTAKLRYSTNNISLYGVATHKNTLSITEVI